MEERDRERLRQFSPTDLRDGLKALSGSNLLDATKEISNNSDAASNGQTVGSNAQTAFKMISSESLLNKIRMENKLKR